MLGTVEGFAFGKVGFAFYLTDRVGPSNIIRKPTSNCSTEPDRCGGHSAPSRCSCVSALGQSNRINGTSVVMGILPCLIVFDNPVGQWKACYFA